MCAHRPGAHSADGGKAGGNGAWDEVVRFRAQAALASGVAGYAMDYDDTQLSTSKGAVYGLLTQPTTPVLAAALGVGEKEKISGEEFLLSYILGVEVECRIADAINPRHYQAGFHSTATMGGLGAAVAAGKILKLKEELLTRIQHGLGLARKFRHHDQTAARRARGGKRRHRGVVGAGRIHGCEEHS